LTKNYIIYILSRVFSFLFLIYSALLLFNFFPNLYNFYIKVFIFIIFLICITKYFIFYNYLDLKNSLT
jgi:hypothetical protein